MNLQHRLSNYNSENPEAFELSCCVENMTARAEATLKIIQNQFVDNVEPLNPELMFYAVESVLMEIADIKAAVSHYYQSQKAGEL